MPVDVDVAITGNALHKHRHSVGIYGCCHNAVNRRIVYWRIEDGRSSGLKIPGVLIYIIDPKLLRIIKDEVFSTDRIHGEDRLFNA